MQQKSDDMAEGNKTIVSELSKNVTTKTIGKVLICDKAHKGNVI